jgi:AAA domain
MNTPLTNGNGGAEPWTYAQKRLHTCGRVISRAPDKLAALGELADGFGADVRQGFLGGQDVVDRLEEVADAYGLVAAHGADVIQRTIAEGMDGQNTPAEAWPQQARLPGSEAPARAKVQISTAEALRTKVFPPIKYIVPGYIAEGCTLLAGRPKIGKSWLMLDVGLAVARGGDCLSSAVPCDAGEVLYLGLEDNERRLQSRITRLLGFAAEWPADFHDATAWPRAQAGGLDQLRRWIGVHDRARLIVIDVLAALRSMRSDRQTPYDADYAAIQALQQIASETGIAIVIVHHTRKSGSDTDAVDKISGTLALSGAADTFLVLDRDSSGATLYGRGRDIEEVDTAVEFDRTACRWRVLGATGEVRRTSERSAILAVLRDVGEPMTPGEIAAAVGMRGDNVRQLLVKMVTVGEIIKAGRGRYVPL